MMMMTMMMMIMHNIQQFNIRIPMFQVEVQQHTASKERLAQLLAPWITRWTTREEPDA